MALLIIRRKKRKALVALSLMASMVSLTLIARFILGFFEFTNLKPYMGLGSVMAEEAAKLTKDNGKVVSITLESPHRMPSVEAQNKYFRKLIRKEGLKLIGEETLDAREFAQASANGATLTSDVFFGILKKYPNADVIVSFIGIPNTLTPEELTAYNKKLPKIVAVAVPGESLKWALEDDIVQTAVILREVEDPHAKASPPETPRDWFDKYYQILRQQDSSSL